MAAPLVTDQLWEQIEPLIPKRGRRRSRRNGGRPPVPDRKCLEGIVFVLRSGIPWQMLPAQMGCGSGSTCWRRLKAWTDAGVWRKLHRRLLDRLGTSGGIDLSRAVIDSASVRALFGGATSGPTPPIVRRTGASGT
jgi:transposase